MGQTEKKKKKKKEKKRRETQNNKEFGDTPIGARTRGHEIKSPALYQLSYGGRSRPTRDWRYYYAKHVLMINFERADQQKRLF